LTTREQAGHGCHTGEQRHQLRHVIFILEEGLQAQPKSKARLREQQQQEQEQQQRRRRHQN
jgi:hypothetical protein